MGHRVVRVSFEVLSDLITGKVRPCASSAPEDLKVVGWMPSHPRIFRPVTIDLVCCSSEWPEDIEGAVLILSEPVFTREPEHAD